jgi:restriction endonuclease Mrr
MSDNEREFIFSEREFDSHYDELVEKIESETLKLLREQSTKRFALQRLHNLIRRGLADFLGHIKKNG